MSGLDHKVVSIRRNDEHLLEKLLHMGYVILVSNSVSAEHNADGFVQYVLQKVQS